jgi:preprotein translocase subunit SecD
VPQGVVLDLNSVRVRLADTDTQLKAKDAIERALNPVAADAAYSVALNLVSNSPNWLTGMHALPMYLGLDLRGGVHFLLQVDMKGALTKRLDSIGADLRSLMRDKNIRHGGISREGQRGAIRFRDAEKREKARRYPRRQPARPAAGRRPGRRRLQAGRPRSSPRRSSASRSLRSSRTSPP